MDSLLKEERVQLAFKDFKNGQYKIISFFAKKARGLMARYVIEQQIDQVDGLKQFNSAGYQFSSTESKTDKLVFTRMQQQD